MHSILLQKSHNLFLLVNKLTSTFPKKERHGLGIRLDGACLNIIETVIEVEQTLPVLKDRALITASVKNEFATILLRICMERKLIKETHYFAAAQLSVEVGKLIGGWRNALAR